MEDKNEKVIIKSYAQPGIDLSVVDLTLVSTVKPRFTKVTKLMYKEKWFTYIGTRDQLDVHDVIQLGCLKLKYKVQKLEKMTDREGYIYKIRRIGDHNTTTLDLDNVELGGSVHIVSRKTFEQMFNYACSLREENPIPTTVDLCNTDACCEPEVEEEIIPPVDPCPPEGCVTYVVSARSNDPDNSHVEYVNCDGELEAMAVDPGGLRVLRFCARPNQNLENPTVVILDVAEGEPCGPCAGTGPTPEPPFRQYGFTRIGGYGSYPKIVIDYTGLDAFNNPVPLQAIIPECISTKLPCQDVATLFCAEYGSIMIDGVQAYATNEPCPISGVCNQDPKLFYIGACP